MSIMTLQTMGAAEQVIEDFDTLAAASNTDGGQRYHQVRILGPLARFVSGQGGRQRDYPLYELCHLVWAVNLLSAVQCPDAVATERQMFFFGLEKVTRATVRHWFSDRMPDAKLYCGRSTPLVEAVDNGICLYFEEGDCFSVSYGRMPFLICVYEYILSMNSFGHYDDFSELFEQLRGPQLQQVALRAIANKVTSEFRRYRRTMIEWNRYEDKFNAILAYLTAHSNRDVAAISDDTIFSFWCSHNQRKEFKHYRAVFNAFADFIRSIERAQHRQADLGHDVSEEMDELEDFTVGENGEWQSPLLVLDAEPACHIRFLNVSRERRRLEPLLHQGPIALRLPRAFIRMEAFAPVQDGIRNDLQLGRGAAAVKARLNCQDALPYSDLVHELRRLREHLSLLMRASYYILMQAQDQALPMDPAAVDQIRVAPTPESREVKRAFHAINRQGFRDADLDDPEILAGHAQGAEALTAVNACLDRFLTVLRRKKLLAEEAGHAFANDLALFRDVLGRLYGAPS